MDFANSSGLIMKVTSMSEVYDYALNTSFLQIGSGFNYVKYRYDATGSKLVPIAEFYNPSYYITLADSSKAISFRFRGYTTSMFCYW
jgi:hypothetical protein